MHVYGIGNGGFRTADNDLEGVHAACRRQLHKDEDSEIRDRRRTHSQKRRDLNGLHPDVQINHYLRLLIVIT